MNLIYVITATAILAIVIALGWMLYEVLTAPELCGECGRPLHGGLCPDCQAEVIAWLEEQGGNDENDVA